MTKNDRSLIAGLVILILAGALFACNNQNTIRYEHGAVLPSEGVSTYEVAEGYQIELIASEPLIADPVDMEIDEYGNMYVVEMSGYPLDKSHTGKIKLLKDKDGDGVMDEGILFADNLMFPNGILRWKKGVLITDAPYVLYLEDSDGDGQADVRDTLLTGFSLSNPHVNVNNPVYGLDNWVYLSHFGRIGTRKYEEEFGDLGEEIRFWERPGSPSLPKNAASKSVRFKPDENQLEMMSSKSQFGHTFDSWGRHFLTHNQNHLYHEVLAAQYLRRKPNLLIASTIESISDHGQATEIYQITTSPDRQLFTPTGVSTSSSGITYYAADLFTPPYSENIIFVAESVSNLVHADVLEPKGATFKASRVQERKEFLASKDFWARPVNMYVGPDGALYVLDYYRRIIEHPEWMSDESVETGGLYHGHNMGRIYRISPVGAPSASWTKGLKLGDSTSEELVKMLAHNNRWWRINAQRLLIDGKDKTNVPVLEKMAATDMSVFGRLHALWTLEGLKALKLTTIEEALLDEDAGIREHAIRLAEPYLDKSSKLVEALLTMGDDSDEKVRFQLLNTLGYVDSEAAWKVCEKILFHDMEDGWIQFSALTAVSLNPEILLKTLLNYPNIDNSAYLSMVRHLTEIVGSGPDTNKINDLVQTASMINGPSSIELNSAVLAGLTQGLNRNEHNKEIIGSVEDLLVNTFFNHPSRIIKEHVFEMLRIVTEHDGEKINNGTAKALNIAADTTLNGEIRAQMLGFLLLTNPTPYKLRLKEFIKPSEEPEVQIMALHVYEKVPGTEVAEYVLDNWEFMTPKVREVALDVMMSEKDRIELLITALEKSKISKSSLGWQRTVQLNSNEDEELRKRARKLLTQDASREIAEQYQEALKLSGDVLNGFEVFKTHCSTCHQVRGMNGVSYGPDLGTVHNWLPKDLLTGILEPGSAIAPGFDLWEIKLNSGEKLQGMIKSETSSAISLKIGPEVEKTVNRQDITEIKSLNSMSPMPGFGGQLDKQEVADLIAFLRDSHAVL